MVAPNTMRAKAASVSSVAVGGSTPGTSDAQLRPAGTRQRADQRQIRSWFGLHRLADLAGDRGDEQFERRLDAGRTKRKAPA
ncbi:hypothetical protein AWL63_24345 (plasmid) [Sphingomonas panacis]|uniref:Uncharacterized protein n=1 Tax=Sphingomonas panacis TaxID=1560345 RepID=A0A1B3ZIN6_9SPHN|nr:hypothetical protein AWL63_24345 [Sphingomonas panacis]